MRSLAFIVSKDRENSTVETEKIGKEEEGEIKCSHRVMSCFRHIFLLQHGVLHGPQGGYLLHC